MAVILLVDDDAGVRLLLSAALAKSGHQVFTASNGLEAVALFRSAPDQVDIVVTDIEMPVMRGDEAIDRIRETRPNVKVICMSGYTHSVPAHTAFLAKPFLPAALLALVTKVLQGVIP